MLIAGGHNGAAAHGDKCVFGVFSHYQIKLWRHCWDHRWSPGDLLHGQRSSWRVLLPYSTCPSLPCLMFWACLLLYWETLQIMAGGQEMNSEPGFGQKGWKCVPFLLSVYVCFPFPIEGEILLEQSDNLCRSQVILNTELPSRAKRS